MTVYVDPMRGFQGFRYSGRANVGDGIVRILVGGTWHPVEVLGGWLDPRPEVPHG